MALAEAAVGWVKAATPITGLDHLGSVAPCIEIYSALLPGMTNVTDRARYYSFYPWFLWKYVQTGEPIESVRFHETFRRADCLFTLIAEHHATVTGGDADRHGSRMVGRDTLVQPLRELKGNASLRLSDFATQDEKGPRYFKNRLGGLGQYYLGTLEMLGILTGRKSDFVQYDPIVGREIASRFEAGVPGGQFWATLSKDTVTSKTLAGLAAYCPCQLSKNVPEHTWLTDLFLGRSSDADLTTVRRRQSLALILHLTQALTSDRDTGIEVGTFRDACYSGSLPNGKPWVIPDSLSGTRDEWRLYERNELLSVSAQALLTIFVRSLELMPQWPASANEVAKFLLSSPALRRIAKRSWQQFVDDCEKTLPDLGALHHLFHELVVAGQLLELDAPRSSISELASAVQRILSILAALAVRSEHAAGPYGDLPITEAFLAEYPINLATFEQSATYWRGLTIGQVVEWLIREWACETHLRIALRKMRSEHRDTFRFYPTENGLKPREIPPFAYSNPRVRQALQILRDIGALEADEGGRFQITKAGSDWLGEVCPS